MKSLLSNPLTRALAAGSLALMLGQAAAAQAITLTASPPGGTYVTGETVDFIVNGPPGGLVVIAGDTDPGPTTIMGVTLNIGFSKNFGRIAMVLDGNGQASVPCAFDCGNPFLQTPVYLQAVLVDNGLFPSNSLSAIWGSQDPDCDGDGEPDACEPDCDEDGIPDDCDPVAGPNSVDQPGFYQLHDSTNGSKAPPFYGLRLDGLCDDYPNVWTFSFDTNGADVCLEYDGKDKVYIRGTAWGGLDTGSEWDPSTEGPLEIDVCYDRVTFDGRQLLVGANQQCIGTVTFLGEEIKLYADGQSTAMHFDGQTLAGWMQYDAGGTQSCCRDWKATAEPVCK